MVRPFFVWIHNRARSQRQLKAYSTRSRRGAEHKVQKPGVIARNAKLSFSGYGNVFTEGFVTAGNVLVRC